MDNIGKTEWQQKKWTQNRERSFALAAANTTTNVLDQFISQSKTSPLPNKKKRQIVHQCTQ
jgi:hypothetical protein